MFGISPKKVFLACAASAVIAHNLTHRCSASYQNNTAQSYSGAQQAASNAGVSSEIGGSQILGPPSLLESKNPASQVASLSHKKQVKTSSSNRASGAKDGGTQQKTDSNSVASPPRGTQPESANDAFLGRHSEEVASSRHLSSTIGEEEIQSEHVFPYSAPPPRLNSAVNEQAPPKEQAVPYSADRLPPRRLQLLGNLSQLTQPLSVFTNLFGDGLSARDRDQFETFSRRVLTSRERVYKDLLFVTGAKFHGLDEYAMKQLVTKVGLENFASGLLPSNVQLSQQESAVLEAAKRSRFQIERIVDTYEREVAQHARTLRQELQTDSSQQWIQQKIESIATNGIYKRRTLSGRHLQQFFRLRRLAALLQGPGLLGAAGSLIRSIDPSNLTNSLNAGLGGLGVHHLRLPNIGGLGIGDDGRAPEPGLEDGNALQRALSAIFPLPQQATAIAGPLRSFQQGVSTATEGAIGAFLSREKLFPFLSIDTTKQLLGSLLGGEAVAADGASGWESLGLAPTAVQGLAARMPFESFLSKLGLLAQEVDSDVGTLRRETKKRIGAGGFPVHADQLLKIDNILDRLVWGALQPPQRRLQQVEYDSKLQPQQEEEEVTQLQQPQQQQTLQLRTQAPPAHPVTPETQQQKPGTQQQQAAEAQQQTFAARQQTSGGQQQAPGDQQQAPGSPQQAPIPQQRKPKPQQQGPGAQQQRPVPPQQQKPVSPQQQGPAGAPDEKGPQQQSPVKDGPVGLPPVGAGDDELDSRDNDSLEDLFDALIEEDKWEKYDPEEKMNAALQRVELLADAVTVLLKEYERAVEYLQKLLEEQVEAAEDIRDEIEEQVERLKKQVGHAQAKKQQQKQQQLQKQQKRHGDADAERASAAAQLAKAYDEAMEGLKDSLEGLLQQQQQKQNVPDPVQQELGSLAAKIEAVVDEKRPSAVATH